MIDNNGNMMQIQQEIHDTKTEKNSIRNISKYKW